ncbi:MAG TPA: Sec-independent protein translocase protein TatB [Rhodanobacteraceae bacterium]
MFDFSLGKLLIVALIALVVLGPDKLPGAARTVGAMIRRVRASWDSVRAEVERELEVEEIRQAARQAAADAEAAQAQTSATLKHLNDELEKVRQAQRELDAAATRVASASVTAAPGAIESSPAQAADEVPAGTALPHHGEAG